jgi:hypothetical protein
VVIFPTAAAKRQSVTAQRNALGKKIAHKLRAL